MVSLFIRFSFSMPFIFRYATAHSIMSEPQPTTACSCRLGGDADAGIPVED